MIMGQIESIWSSGLRSGQERVRVLELCMGAVMSQIEGSSRGNGLYFNSVSHLG